MVWLGFWLLEDSPGSGDDYGVCCDDEGWVGDGGERVSERNLVDVQTFLIGGLEDVFEGS